jgi:DNA (cytosine-5)-methyltransferase 1
MTDEKNKGATDGMVLPKDGLRELALFAGAGGGILGGLLHGWRTVAAVEIEDYPRRVLLQRQADGILPRFPIWDDVCTFDGKPWRGKVDVVSGGFPCQDISCAGKGAGLGGERSGLWSEMVRIIGEVRPQFVFVENSPMLVSRGLEVCLSDLAEMGYDARWGVVGADDAGAPHRRKRIWIVAHTNNRGLPRQDVCKEQSWRGKVERTGKVRAESDVADSRNVRGRGRPIANEEEFATVTGYGENTNTKGERLEGFNGKEQHRRSREGARDDAWKMGTPLANTCGIGQQGQGQSWYSFDPASKKDWEAVESQHGCLGDIWGIKSPLGRVANGVANRSHRLKAIGNGQVPACAALAWQILNGGDETP